MTLQEEYLEFVKGVFKKNRKIING